MSSTSYMLDRFHSVINNYCWASLLELLSSTPLPIVVVVAATPSRLRKSLGDETINLLVSGVFMQKGACQWDIAIQTNLGNQKPVYQLVWS